MEDCRLDENCKTRTLLFPKQHGMQSYMATTWHAKLYGRNMRALIRGWAYCLNAINTNSLHTWLSSVYHMINDTLEVRPFGSSCTREGSSQCSKHLLIYLFVLCAE